MQAYRTHLIIKDPQHVILSNLPFQSGQYVEVLFLARESRTVQRQEIEALFRETQSLPQAQAVSEKEIAAEIAAFRSGQ